MGIGKYLTIGTIALGLGIQSRAIKPKEIASFYKTRLKPAIKMVYKAGAEVKEEVKKVEEKNVEKREESGEEKKVRERAAFMRTDLEERLAKNYGVLKMYQSGIDLEDCSTNQEFLENAEKIKNWIPAEEFRIERRYDRWKRKCVYKPVEFMSKGYRDERGNNGIKAGIEYHF